MQQELISIIIPVYNVEKYLNQCLDSVINQTYRNLEIILVDDGSTDSSGLICDEYKGKDERITVIHKKNGGLSDARNVGIEICSGRYITFIDSDDYVLEDYVGYLYELLYKYNADMSVCDKVCFKEHEKIKDRKQIIKEESIDKETALLYMMYGSWIDVSAWCKLYKKELFDNIRYTPNLLFEDSDIIYKLIDKCNKICVSNKSEYCYRINPNSITNSGFNIKKMDLITATEGMRKYIAKNYPYMNKAADRRMIWALFSTLNQLYKSKPIDKEIENKIINEIRKYDKTVFFDKQSQFRDKVGIMSLRVGKGFYRFMWRLYCKIYKNI